MLKYDEVNGMNNEEKILAILEKMQTDIAEIKETLSDHTIALNELLGWADDAQVVVKIPFGQVKENK